MARACTTQEHLPRDPGDSLVVVTGLSGSGKSSLAFDTIYAKGSAATWNRCRATPSGSSRRLQAGRGFRVRLSPVISIEQRRLPAIRARPSDDDRHRELPELLFATIGVPHCPRTGEEMPSRSSNPDSGGDLALPRARRSSCARLCSRCTAKISTSCSRRSERRGAATSLSTAKRVDISAKGGARRVEGARHGRVVDRFVVSRKHEKAIKAGIAATYSWRGLMQIHIFKGAGKSEADRFYKAVCSARAPLRVRRRRA